MFSSLQMTVSLILIHLKIWIISPCQVRFSNTESIKREKMYCCTASSAHTMAHWEEVLYLAMQHVDHVSMHKGCCGSEGELRETVSTLIGGKQIYFPPLQTKCRSGCADVTLPPITVTSALTFWMSQIQTGTFHKAKVHSGQYPQIFCSCPQWAGRLCFCFLVHVSCWSSTLESGATHRHHSGEAAQPGKKPPNPQWASHEAQRADDSRPSHTKPVFYLLNKWQICANRATTRVSSQFSFLNDTAVIDTCSPSPLLNFQK